MRAGSAITQQCNTIESWYVPNFKLTKKNMCCHHVEAIGCPSWVFRRKLHNDVIKWKYFPRYWPFVRGIHRPPVNSPHKGQWRRAMMFSLICSWINCWVNSRESGDLGCHRAHYDVTVMGACSNKTGHYQLNVYVEIKLKSLIRACNNSIFKTTDKRVYHIMRYVLICTWPMDISLLLSFQLLSMTKIAFFLKRARGGGY